jgi:hypothetical protein
MAEVTFGSSTTCMPELSTEHQRRAAKLQQTVMLGALKLFTRRSS